MFEPDITAVMITGKTTERYPLAMGAVKSFQSQVYGGRKLLLVINDNQIPLYPDATEIPQGVVELHIRHPRKYNLGELRNLAFEHVLKGSNSYMIQWDDDDFSHPKRLQHQIDGTVAGGASILKWQTQYDTVNGQGFAGCGVESSVKGFAGTMLFPADTKVRFSEKDKGEDTDFLVALRKQLNLRVLSESPTMFLHFCHPNNTWSRGHVMKRRRGSRDLSASELSAVQQMVRENYPWANIQ